MDDLHERVGQAAEAEVDAKIAEIRQVFDVAEPGPTRSPSRSPRRRCAGRPGSPAGWTGWSPTST